ncbi:hypothetical protein FHG87_011655, partial [Trinorchestia longiramus]
AGKRFIRVLQSPPSPRITLTRNSASFSKSRELVVPKIHIYPHEGCRGMRPSSTSTPLPPDRQLKRNTDSPSSYMTSFDSRRALRNSKSPIEQTSVKSTDEKIFKSPLRQLLRSPRKVSPSPRKAKRKSQEEDEEDDILMGPSLQEILGSTDRMLATFSDFEDFELIDASESESEVDESEQKRRLLRDKWKQLFDKFDHEGFGEIPWPEFRLVLEHPEFVA